MLEASFGSYPEEAQLCGQACFTFAGANSVQLKHRMSPGREKCYLLVEFSGIYLRF